MAYPWDISSLERGFTENLTVASTSNMAPQCLNACKSFKSNVRAIQHGMELRGLQLMDAVRFRRTTADIDQQDGQNGFTTEPIE